MDFLEAVRLEIGDKPNNGILPGNEHFTDGEIQYAATAEGVEDTTVTTDRDIGRTSAKLLEIAAVQWSSQPDEVELGPAAERGGRSAQLRQQSGTLRDRWGYGGGGRTETSTSSRAPGYVGVGSQPGV